MHILFLTPAYPPFQGGGERYVANLAAQLVDNGYQLTIVTSIAENEQAFWRGQTHAFANATVGFPQENPKIVRCGLRPFPGRRLGLLLWRKAMVLLSSLPGDGTPLLKMMAHHVPPLKDPDKALAQVPLPVDIVHGFNISWESVLLLGQAFAHKQKLPFVVTPFAHLGVAGHDRVARNSTMDHQLRCLRNAQRVLTLTSIEREGLLGFGLAPQRVDVIGGGVIPWKKTIDTAVPKKAYQLSSPYILFIGRVSFEKGAIHAAKAVLKLRRQGIKVDLALVGHIAPEFGRYLSDLPADEQTWIRPLGSVSEADKQALLDGAELLVLPSRTDSFGIVLLEAWSHGKAVIGAHAGGIPGVIDDKTNGLLVEFGDVDGLATAVAALLADETWRHTLGQNGRLKSETEYTWPRVAERVISHYEQLTGIT